MRDCEVMALSKFPEIFEGFRESVDRDAPHNCKTVLWDTEQSFGVRAVQRWSQWIEVDAGRKFAMAANANVGWHCVPRDADILYAGDDTRIIEPDTIKRLQELAYSDPEIGILSPRIVGHAQTVQTHPNISPITFCPLVAFVFVYIKREVIDKIGYLDERFEGYGVEDIDYCYRARLAGFKIGVAKDISVKHGVNGHTYGSTFIKVRGEEQMGKDDRANWTRFADKWGIENDPRKIMEFIGAA